MSGKYEMDNNTATFFTVCAVVAGISIMWTASALSPDQCTSEKVKAARFEAQIDAQRFEIPNGKCVDFPQTEQRICRNKHDSKFSITNIPQGGIVVNEGEGEL